MMKKNNRRKGVAVYDAEKMAKKKKKKSKSAKSSDSSSTKVLGKGCLLRFTNTTASSPTNGFFSFLGTNIQQQQIGNIA